MAQQSEATVEAFDLLLLAGEVGVGVAGAEGLDRADHRGERGEVGEFLEGETLAGGVEAEALDQRAVVDQDEGFLLPIVRLADHDREEEVVGVPDLAGGVFVDRHAHEAAAGEVQEGFAGVGIQRFDAALVLDGKQRPLLEVGFGELGAGGGVGEA